MLSSIDHQVMVIFRIECRLTRTGQLLRQRHGILDRTVAVVHIVQLRPEKRILAVELYPYRIRLADGNTTSTDTF